MATKKPTKGRKKKRPSYIKFFIIALLCFGAGVLTYATLDCIFSHKQSVVKQEKSAKTSQKPNQKQNTKTKKSSQKPSTIIPLPDENLTIALNEIMTKSNKETIPTKNIEQEINHTQELEAIKPSQESIKDFTNKETLKPSKFSKGKLAIIIDDMASSSQVNALKSVGIKLTPSFFPPNKGFSNTPNLASKFEFYMIHLPLEANSHKDRLKTLTTHDDYETIEQTIKSIRQNFPKAKFINNHTGSKFTSNLTSSKMLIKALDKYGFIFVDSRTINTTKIPVLAKSMGFRYIARDVFLDNKNDFSSIRKELQRAVDIANKRGYAIAIGHPKNITFKTLKNSQDILQNVEVVYLSEIYEYYK